MKYFHKSIMLIVLCFSILGCNHKATSHPEPSSGDVQKAFEKAIIHLNEKIGADISSFNYDWIEVPSDCYGQLDYYAQQLLWAYIFQEDAVSQNVFYIDCSVAEKYSELSVNS
jgi:hypothetical protein